MNWGEASIVIDVADILLVCLVASNWLEIRKLKLKDKDNGH